MEYVAWAKACGLIGPQTINTLPVGTIATFKQKGVPVAQLGQNLIQTEDVVTHLAQTGIDLKRLTDQLLTRGIEKFKLSLINLFTLLEKSVRLLCQNR